MLKGIDISQFQPTVDFNLLKTQIDFIIIRSSYGDGYIDKSFYSHRDQIKKNNIPHGYYHYSYPQYNTPEAEADWFLKTVGSLEEGELLCLDFEESYSDPVGWCKRFLDHISNRLNGYKPLLYINLSTARAFNWSPVIDGNYGLWLAQWDKNPNSSGGSTNWSVTAIRQYTDSETISGITGRVDGDVFYGDLNSFKFYGYRSVQEKPVITPVTPVIPVPPSPPSPLTPIQSEPTPPQTPIQSELPPSIPIDLLTLTSNEAFLNSLKSRKFILSVVASGIALLNSVFGTLQEEQLLIVIIPLILFIAFEGLADIVERSKTSLDQSK